MASEFINEEEEDEIDLLELWGALRENIGLIIKAVLVCLIIAGGYLAVVAPTYESTAMIRIKQDQGIGKSLLDSIPGGNTQATKELISTYQEILKSRSVVEPIIPEVTEPDKDGKYPKYSEQLVTSLITTAPFKDTEMVKISFKGKSPEEAQHSNDLLLDSFMKRLTELDREQAHTTSGFIEERLNQSKAELAKAEDVLSKFQEANKVLSPDSDVKLTADKLSAADKLKAENEVALATAQAQNAAVNQQLQNNSIAVADNNVIKDYQKKLTELEAQRISYIDKYTANHPNVIAVNEQIAGIKEKLSGEIDKVARLESPSDNQVHQKLISDKFQSEAAIAVAQSNLAAVKSIEDRYKGDISKLSQNQKQYLRYMRDVTVSQEIYMMLAKRLEESKVAEVSVTRNVFIVDAPDLPEKPISPKKGRTLAIAFAIGLLASCAFIIVRHLMNATIRTAEDIDKYLGLPVLAQIPLYSALDKVNEEANMSGFSKLWRSIWKK